MTVADDREELRLGLVMSGGVSLAVWIGGVTYEIGRLVADTGRTAYSELCALTGVTPHVDVIAGTSAGGINGAFLAMAMAYHQGVALEQQLDALRDLWINKGALADLLRAPLTRHPPSLLDGDGYFLGELHAAFRNLKADGTLRDDVPIELLLTTTMLNPEIETRSDDFGVRIADASHRARLHFTRRRKDGGDDFADAEIADRLALAARCTSSFPAAFEPSFCPIGADATTPDHPDMKPVASFKTSGFVIDGGVLDNQPLDVAVDAIFRQRATGPVRRVLAYVVPDPASADVAPPAASPGPPAPPAMLDVLMSTVVRIPMVQSVAGLIDSLRDHNAKVRERRYARVLLTSYNTPQQIDALAATLFNAYRAVRLEMAVNYILGRIEAGLLRAQSAGLGQSGRRDWLHQRILERMGSLPWLPQAPPDTSVTAQVPVWHWGTRPVEHSVRVLLDLLSRAQQLGRLIPRVEPYNPAYLRPDFLADEWARAFELLENTAVLRSRDADHWLNQAAAVQQWLGTGHGKSHPPQAAQDWLDQAIDGWQSEPPRQPPDATHPLDATQTPHAELTTTALAEQYAREVAQVLIDLGPRVAALLRFCAGGDLPERTRQAKELASLYGYFVRDGENPGVGAVVGRLLAFEVVQEALGGRGTMPEEAIDFIQISAQGASAFGGYSEPNDKLAGVQLAHFGAFYKKSWRANDWMWGRLDAIRRLVRIVLAPELVRVQALTIAPGNRAREMAGRIADIALGGAQPARDTLPPETRTELQNGFTREAIEAELGYLDHPHDVMPEFLQASVEAVCRRLELDVLQQELPLVADAVQADQADNARLSPMAQSFLIASGRWPPPVPPNPLHALLHWYAHRPAVPPPIPADKVRALLAQCQLGREKIEDDVGTDRLTVVAAQTTTLAISTMTQQDGWLVGFGSLMGMLRTPALLFYLFTQSALLGSKTGLAFNVALFIAGVAIVATAVLANVTYPDWLFLVAISAFVAGLLFLVMRIRWWLRILLMIAAAAGIGWFVYLHRPLPALPPAVWITIAVVEVLWLGFALLCRVSGSRARSRV